MSIAFFDVDYTLVDGNSGFYTSLHLVRHGILKKRRVFQAIYYLSTSVFIHHDVRKTYQIAIQDMAGQTLKRILEIGKESFERDIKKRLFPKGIDLIKKHQEAGDHVVLLSSGPYMVLHWIRDYLKAHDFFSMGPTIENGILTNQLQLPICHAEGKIHFAEEYSKKVGSPLSEAYFYTDHHSDIPLLEKVGKPITVNPTRKLKKHALRKNWEILRFMRN